jgi:transaldolase
MSDPLAQLSAEGVAVWLDDLSRDRILFGGLARLVQERHVVGVTTNPTIFQTAISKSSTYDLQLADLARHGADANAAVRALTTDDVRNACDVLAQVAKDSDQDGRVSLEVEPGLARDTDGTIGQARELWSDVGRPNLFIKIPATVEGLPAIEQALSEGISVNVTLIFSIERYRGVMEAYLRGLERRVEAGESLDGLASVASFFVSRVDTEIDKRLEAIGSEQARGLRGNAAIANARLAYQAYEEVFSESSPRWQRLREAGAFPQRPLWASTGVKNPDYSDTMYVTELVAPGTVNTMPEATMEAVFDHGELHGDAVRGRYGEAAATMSALADVGVDVDDVVRVLEDEGLEKFQTSWDDLLSAVADSLEDHRGEYAGAR